jgi:cytochrome b
MNMSTETELSTRNDLDVFARVIHLGLLIFGVLGLLSGEWAEDYEKIKHLGFTIHSWLGMGLALFIFFRLIYGLIGPKNVRFTQWIPYTKNRFRLVLHDLLNLVKFRLPERPVHQGLAGLVQTFGLAVFSWMALTGSLMFFFLEPGREARGILHLIEEAHEIGETAIPLFLALHVGAVVMHALFGRHIWRRMLFLEK